MNVQIDKLSSVASAVVAGETARIGEVIPARAGVVVVGRLLDDMPHELEIADGRMVAAWQGDIVVGALGARRALRGVAGEMPAQVAPGDVLHVLNRGGVVGRAVGAGAARLAILGCALGTDGPLHIGEGGLTPLSALPGLPPIIAIAGSCMHAGKTAAAVALVRALKTSGYRVGVVKLTGVAAQRDVRAMLDAGAVAAATFVDGGITSTCGEGDVVGIARACLVKVAEAGADIIVAELGDGLLGDYGVDAILAAHDIRDAISAIVLSAVDPVAAWGGVELLRRHGLTTSAVTGAATDNVAGAQAVSRHTGVATANARSAPQALCHLVLDALNKIETPLPMQPSLPAHKSTLRMAALAAAVMGGA